MANLLLIWMISHVFFYLKWQVMCSLMFDCCFFISFFGKKNPKDSRYILIACQIMQNRCHIRDQWPQKAYGTYFLRKFILVMTDKKVRAHNEYHYFSFFINSIGCLPTSWFVSTNYVYKYLLSITCKMKLY